MRWSLRLGSISGIDIRVHFTFALLVVLIANELGRLHGSRGALFGTLVIVCLFGCVVLHELGHGLVAQRFGVGVREIVLLPIGGVARLLSEPKKPLHELLIAIAGPLVNVVIAVGLLLGLQVSPLELADVGQLQQQVMAAPTLRGLLMLLLYGNLALAMFNMVPALPMDGGRVLRAVLSFFVGQVRATNLAAGLAQMLAVGLGFYGLQNDPLLVFIAILVFMGAGQERATARTNQLLSELHAAEVCDPQAVTFAPGDTVGAAIDQTLRSSQAHFLVTHGVEPIGTLSRDDVIALAGRVGLHAPLATITRRSPTSVPPEMALSEVRRILQENSGSPVVVRSSEAALGVLGLEDIARIASLTDHLARGGVRRQVAPNPETSGLG
ncbi:MAG TPA: site-2 protease family protein [Polyangiaceae bacterium]|nr:site-2 protease family protein [Polyangiaceae bacterium]